MGSVGCWGSRSGSAIPLIQKPRAWSSGPTAIWRPRSCPAGPSRARRTSTPNWTTGWGWSTSGRGGCWAAPRRIGSTPTGPRCCRCRRSPHRPGGTARCGSRATTTSGWTATTTRSTRPWSAAVSRSAPTWSGCECGATGGWSLTIGAAGPATRRSATPPTCRPPPSCATSGQRWAPPTCAKASRRSSGAAWPTTTPRSA
jgi:hypothetical protein